MKTLLIVALLSSATVARADDKPVSDRAKIAANHPAWFDITTTSMAKSKEFYGRLFGWTFASMKGVDVAATIVSGTEEIGSLRVAEGAISAYDGVVYIAVDDMVAACKKATSLGGKIPEGFPFNVPGKGAIGLVTDPVGHPIGLYSKNFVPEKKERATSPAR